jgi:hypothetical protein
MEMNRALAQAKFIDVSENASKIIFNFFIGQGK